ncbi:MAG: 50S ribosomal protein L18 [Candidatus Aminicenantes bacterium]|nr:50S ribosomal protein L18 [Candidatus Aminicenantes bacterium]
MKESRRRIRKRIRKKIEGTAERPRLLVLKSNRFLYTHVIDDVSGKVITSVSTLDKAFKEKNKSFKNMKASSILGEMLAKKLKEKKIKNVVFDRGYYPYHGRIKALADAVRKQGIII